MKKLLNGNLFYLLLYLFISCLFNFKAFTEGILLAPAGTADGLFLNYPLRLLYGNALRSFEFPLWSPYEFAGMPFLGTIYNGALYPINLALYFLLSPPCAYNVSYILHFALGGWFTFLYARLIGASALPAFAAGIVFGFTGFVAANHSHTAKVNSAVYLPLIIYFLEKLRRSPEFKYSLFVSLAVAVQIFAGDFQVCTYTYIVVLMFLVFYASSGGKRFVAFGALALSIGFLIALPQIVSAVEMSGSSWMRARKIQLGYEYFTSFHVYAETLLTLFFPYLFGPMSPRDAMLILMGVMPVVFSAVVFVKEARSNSHVLFWGIVAGTGLFLSLGGDNPLYRLLYHVPVYSQFRSHGRNMLEFTFAASVLSGVCLQKILYENQREYIKNSLIAFAVVLALSTGLLLAFPHLPLNGIASYLNDRGFQNLHLLGETLNLWNKYAYVPLIFAALYAAWTAVFARRRHLKYLIVPIIAFEAFFINLPMDKTGPEMSGAWNLCATEPYYAAVSADAGDYRVVNLISKMSFSENKYNPNANITCRRGSVTGYNPFAIEKYVSLFDIGLLGLGNEFSWEQIIRRNAVLSMMGGKYIKAPKDLRLAIDDVRADDSPPSLSELPPVRWSLGNGAIFDGGYRLRSPAEGKEGVIYGPATLDAGTYAITLNVRAPEGRDRFSRVTVARSLGTRGYYPVDRLVIPGDILNADYKEFHRIVTIKEGGLHMLNITTRSERPVEFTDFSIKKFEHYNPPFLGIPAGDSGTPVYEKVSETADFDVYTNRNSLPKAWSVSRLVAVRDFDDALKRLDFLEVNPLKEAMLSEADIRRIGKDRFTGGEVSIAGRGLNEVLLRASFPAEGFIVLADQYFPGWRAYVDGKETEIYETNGILRGVAVPAGEHEVAFRYRPGGIMASMALSLIILTAMAVYLSALSLRGRYNRKAL